MLNTISLSWRRYVGLFFILRVLTVISIPTLSFLANSWKRLINRDSKHIFYHARQKHL